MKRIVLGLLAATAMSAGAFAADIKPAIIYDLGGKFDKSFNEAAYNGAEKFKTETGIEYRDFEIQNDAQREQALRKFAEDGNNPIVMAGFSWEAALKKVAAEFPDLQFAIIDMVVDLPNVRSVVFKEHEGSYLVGVLAAMASQSKKVGFVGGMDIPLIRKFGCGYVGGAKAAGATRRHPEHDRRHAGGLERSDQGRRDRQVADRPGRRRGLRAAGGTGVGVLQAAADAGKLGIGVDSNQNGLHPGKVLTSMVKRVDVAVYNAFKDAQDGKFTPGLNNLGLKEDGVGYAMDDNNKALVTDEMKAAVEKAKANIIAGTIQVHDYMSDNACPY